MSLLKVSGIYRKQGSEFELKDISFTQRPSQKIAIAGETGSGKSTLLKIIAGLMNADAGEVVFENERVKKVPEEKLIPGHKGIAYLSQHFELPHYLTVGQVLSYSSLLPDEEATAIYEIFRITHLLDRRTDKLSGGEKQRIAMAKLLVASPRLLVLDEPFSNLDMIHKTILKAAISDMGEKLGITCLLTSHDPLDTISWADDIFIIKNGVFIQHGPPQDIYSKPVNEYVAALFGKYNLIHANKAQAFYESAVKGKDLLIRPEGIKVITDGSHTFTGEVKAVFYFGSYYETEILAAGVIITARTAHCDWAKGSLIELSLSPEDVWHL